MKDTTVPTIDDLILSIEVEREQTQKRYERATAEANGILARAKSDGRANLSAEEDKDMDDAFATRDRAVIDLKGIDNKLARANKIKAEEQETDLALRERGATPKPLDGDKPSYDRVARIGEEPRTYNKRNDRDGSSFLRDVSRQFLYRDMESEQRLLRHMQEERVERGAYLQRAAGDATTGAFAGLTVPQYLTEMYAPAVANMRPFADQCNKHELPASGMTVNISQITTATSAALQATELATVSTTSIDDTLLTENVQTAAGSQLLSRQAIDRSTGVEGVIMDDLFRRYASVLDSTLINQATTGLSALAADQTWTTASPTGQLLYSQLSKAQSTVESVLLGYAQADLVVMHPRRWHWLVSSIGSTWPAVFGGGQPQTVGNNNHQDYNKGIRGTIASGLDVVTDANVTTVASGTALTGGAQDHVYIVPRQEMHLWEDSSAPVFIRAEQTAAANLGVLLVLYGYFAYSFRRYGSGSTVKISGTGVTTPSF